MYEVSTSETMSGIQLSPPSPQNFADGVLSSMAKRNQRIAMLMATPSQRRLLENINPATHTFIFIDQEVLAAIVHQMEDIDDEDLIFYIFKHPNLVPEFEQVMRAIVPFPEDDYEIALGYFDVSCDLAQNTTMFLGFETPELHWAALRCDATKIENQLSLDGMGLFHMGVSNIPLAPVAIGSCEPDEVEPDWLEMFGLEFLAGPPASH